MYYNNIEIGPNLSYNNSNTACESTLSTENKRSNNYGNWTIHWRERRSWEGGYTPVRTLLVPIGK
ncbi:hypothetical protein ARMGADRAFT_239148 [Armillaria gallica]|uniref:Uncharacterized protein n=1 Tax=Armillaria gallica TaxID=47427 RepID=A0A2H3EMX7_ARMGA|nr:hypothetical protein ARMGADRAFT_239148 [Armillaria gallica]